MLETTTESHLQVSSIFFQEAHKQIFHENVFQNEKLQLTAAPSSPLGPLKMGEEKKRLLPGNVTSATMRSMSTVGKDTWQQRFVVCVIYCIYHFISYINISVCKSCHMTL